MAPWHRPRHPGRARQQSHRGGQPSWNDAWLERLLTNSRGVEHPARYVNYIIEARRRAGLPDLTGYILSRSGPVFLEDTAERFAAHRARTDHDIAAQIAGERPVWGWATWPEEWEARIRRALILYGSSAGRYVDYIHQARRNVSGQ